MLLMLSYKIEFFSLCKYFHWYLSTIQISYAVGFFSPSVSSVKGKDVSVSMQDLKLTLKSCVRITKDKNVGKKTPQKSKPIKPKDPHTNHDKTNKQGGKKHQPPIQEGSSETISRFKHYLSKWKS